MVTVDAGEVAGFLRTANKMTGKTVPVFGMVRMRATAGMTAGMTAGADGRVDLTVSTCNESGMYSAVIPCANTPHGTAHGTPGVDFDMLIDAKKILAIMNNCRGLVTISVTDYWVSITGAGAKYNIVSTSADNWPELDAIEGAVAVTSGMLSAMLYAISPVRSTNNEMRAHVAGFLVDGKDGMMRFSSTDSSRLHSVVGVDGYTGAAVVVNKNAIPAMQQMRGAKEIAIGETHMVVRGERETLTIRLLNSAFPAIDEMLTTWQSEGYAKITFDRVEMTEALDRAAVLNDTGNTGVLLSFTNGSLKIQTTNPDLGEFATEIETDGDVNTNIYVNLQYVLDALHLVHNQSKSTTAGATTGATAGGTAGTTTAEEQQVDMRIKDEKSPVFIINGTTTVVMMPMRL